MITLDKVIADKEYKTVSQNLLEQSQKVEDLATFMTGWENGEMPPEKSEEAIRQLKAIQSKLGDIKSKVRRLYNIKQVHK